MQEYVAMMLNVPVGKYYHFVNNLHVYDDFLDLVKTISNYDENDFKTNECFYYDDKITFEDFNREVVELFKFEEMTREDKSILSYNRKNSFFEDWGKIFLVKNKIKPVFNNPFLYNLFGG